MALVLGTNAGFVTTAPTADPAGTTPSSEYTLSAIKHIFPQGATKVTEIGFYVDNATNEANFEVGIYDHDSGNNSPGNLLAGASQTNAKGTGAGWKKSAVDITLTPGTTYWIAHQLDQGSSKLNYSSVAGTRWAWRNYLTTFPDTWSGGIQSNISDDLLFGIYAVYESEAPAGTNIKINIGDVWKDVAEIKINIGDAWKSVIKVQQNIGDVWKTVFG